MRRIILYLLLGGFALFASCEQLPVNVQEDEYITVRFSVLNADIAESDVPLETKSGDTEYTYVIEAKQLSTNTSEYEQYARGVFDSSDNIAIRLKSGKKYSFKVALLKDFFCSGWLLNAYSNTDTTYYAANNKFVYDGKVFEQLHGGISFPFHTNTNPLTNYDSIDCDSFYGTVSEYTASANGSISVSLSRTATYLEVKTTGLTEGKIGVSEGIFFTIEYPTTSYTGWMTDNRFVNGEETFNTYLRFDYYPPGVEVGDYDNSTLLVRQQFTFKRNYKKTITLNITHAAPTESSNGISINVSEVDLLIDESEEFDCEID